MRFFYDNFKNKFLLYCHTKTYVSNLMHFQGKNGSFSFKNKTLRSEIIKILFELFLLLLCYGNIPTPPRVQGLLTEVWQRRKRQK